MPDIEFMFRGAPADPHLWFPLIRPAYADGYGIRPTLLHPDSRGEIRLRSTDPRDPPRIFYNFLSAPNDLPPCAKASSWRATSPIRQPMAAFRGAETSPGAAVKTDADIDGFIRRTAITAHHPCGTCAMGSARCRHRPRAAGARHRAACAWSTPRSCRISSRRTSTPAC